MTDGEFIYLIGVIAAFAIFAVTLAAVSHGQHLPPAGSEGLTRQKPAHDH
jgi:hypothetical protein